MANVGTAKVTIEADFGKFESDMDSFFGKTGKAAGKALDEGVQDGAGKAEKAAQDVAKSTQKAASSAKKAGGEAASAFDGVATGAAKSADAAASSFSVKIKPVGTGTQEASAVAARALADIGSKGAAAGSSAATGYSSAISGIGSSSADMAARASASLASIASSGTKAGSATATGFSSSVSGVSSSASAVSARAAESLASIAGAGSSAGSRASTGFSTAISGITSAASSAAARAGEALQGVVSSATSAGSAVKSKLTDAFQSTHAPVDALPGKIGAIGGALAAVAGPMAMFKGGFDRLMNIQKAEIMFKNVGLSAQETSDYMAHLTDQITGTSVSLGDASKYAAMFAQSGVEMGKPMDDTITAFTNLAAAAEGSGVDVGRVLQQISAQGKVSGEDLMQFSDAGINAAQYLADSMGMSVADVRSAVSDGKVSFEDFTTAVNSGMGSFAKEMGETLPAKMSNFKTSVSNLGAAILEPLIGPFTTFVEVATAAFKQATIPVKAFFGAVQAGNPIALALVGVMGALATTAMVGVAVGMFQAAKAAGTLSKMLKILNLQFVMSGPGLIVLAIIAVIAIFVVLWKKCEGFRDFWKGLWDTITSAVSDAWAKISPVFDTIKAAWEELTAAFSGGDWGYGALASLIGDGAAENVVNAFAAVGDAVRTAWEWIKKLGGVVADVGKSLLSAGLDAAVSIFQSLWAVVKALFGAVVQIGKAFWDLAQVLAPVLWPVLKVIGIVVGGVLVGAFFALMGALKLVAGIVKVVATVIKWLAENVLAPLIGVLGTVASFLIGVLAGAFRILFSVVKTVAGAIGTAVSAVWEFLQAAWETVGVPVMEAIKTGFGAVRDFIVGAWEGVKTAFTAVWEFLQAAWESVGAPIFEVIKTVIGIAIDAIVIGFKLIGATFEVIWIALGKAWETFGQPVIDFIVAAFQFWWSGIQIIFGYLQDGWNLLWGWLQIAWATVGQPVVDGVKNAFQWMWDGVQAIFGWLKDRFTDMVRGFQIMWDTVGRPVVDAVVGGFNWVKDGITNALNWVKDQITAAGRKISELYSTYVQPMVDSVINGFNRVKDTVTGWKDKIVGALSDAGSWLIDTGKNIVQGLLDGIGSLAGSIGEFFLDKIPGWIKGPFKKALGIHSPSRVFAGYGKSIGQGLVNGVKSMSGQVQKASQALADSAGNVEMPDLTVSGTVDMSQAASSAPSAALPAPVATGMGSAESDAATGVSEDPSADFTAAATGMEATAASVLTPMWAQQNLDMTTWGTTAVTQATGVVAPALSSVGASALLMQTTQWTPAMAGMSSAFTSTAATTAMQAGGVMNPALNSVAATSWNVLNTGVNPAMAGMRGAALQTAGTFGQAAGMIAQQWSAVREATAAPVRFAINSVFNDGIVGMWNSVSDMLGTSKMGTYPVRFASGGYVRGPGGPTADRIPALLSDKEFVLNAKTVKQFGHKNLAALNSGKIGLADGVLNQPGEVKAMMRDKTFRRVASRYQTGGIVQGSPAWKDLLRGYEWARQRNGRPYVWGGSANGSGGADCSGFMSGISDVILGGNGARQWTTYSFPGGQPFVPGLASGFSVGVSSEHTAGTIGGVPGIPAVNVESGGINSRMKFGTSDAAGADDGQFPRKAHLAYTGDGKFLPGAGGGASIGQIIAGMTKEAGDRMRSAAAGWQSSHPGLMNTYPSALAKTLGDATQKKIDKLVEEMMAFTAGNAESYRGMIKAAYRRQGFQWSQAKEDAWVRQIQSESNGNPLAVQNGYVDVNTGGNEAKGLLQIAGSTWPGARDPELPDNIFDPWANINAAIRYAERKYGANLLNVIGHGHGYDLGGLISKTGLFSKQTTEAERVLSPRQTRSFEELVGILGSSAWDQFSATVSRSQSAVPAGGPTRIHEVTQNFYGNTDAEAAGDAVENRLTRKAW